MLDLIFMNWWGEMDTIQQIFWGIAIVFSVFFIIQFILSMVGVDFDADGDIDLGGDPNFTVDADFTIFSIRSIIAFFTLFGWTGGLILNNGGSLLTAIIASTIVGGIAAFSIAYLMFSFAKLAQSGTVEIQEALYNEGTVYLTIPESNKGRGKINVQIQGAFREMDAITEGQALSTGTPVRVIEVMDDNVLLVVPLDK